jgi:hypothetical protein
MNIILPATLVLTFGFTSVAFAEKINSTSMQASNQSSVSGSHSLESNSNFPKATTQTGTQYPLASSNSVATLWSVASATNAAQDTSMTFDEPVSSNDNEPQTATESTGKQQSEATFNQTSSSATQLKLALPQTAPLLTNSSGDLNMATEDTLTWVQSLNTNLVDTGINPETEAAKLTASSEAALASAQKLDTGINAGTATAALASQSSALVQANQALLAQSNQHLVSNIVQQQLQTDTKLIAQQQVQASVQQAMQETIKTQIQDSLLKQITLPGSL